MFFVGIFFMSGPPQDSTRSGSGLKRPRDGTIV